MLDEDEFAEVSAVPKGITRQPTTQGTPKTAARHEEEHAMSEKRKE
jgi:hypothetical protein